MEFLIKNLTEVKSYPNSKEFGNKALMLSKIEKYDVNVLPGFCILIMGGGSFEREKLKNNMEFREQYTRLIGSKKHWKLIARSSGMMEDSEEHLFPGIYESVLGIINMEQLLDAAEKCYESQKSSKARWYSNAVHADDMGRFCVLIQRELESEYSGIAYTKLPFEGYWSGGCMMVQMVYGACAMLASGVQEGNTYVLHDRLQHWGAEKEIHYKCLDRKAVVDEAAEQGIMEDLYKTGRKLAEIIGSELDIEWAYWSGRIYILQARPLMKKNLNGRNLPCPQDKPDRKQLFEQGNDNGMKWNAMKYFIENGMFEKRVLLLEAHLSLDEVKRRLYDAEFLEGALTVRFSYKNQIGMPRAFTPGKQEAYEFIKRNWTEECALIIYESIFVQDSYELYVDMEKIILEHVPGVWESDSKLLADSVVIRGENAEFWRVEVPREAKFEDYLGCSKRVVPPLLRNELIQEREQLRKYADKIRRLGTQAYPINFHYVKDNRRRTYFLNCRFSEHITDFYAVGKEAYPIKSCEDFDGWNGRMPLLICPDLGRGEEIALMEIVPRLRGVSVPILVDFGILSHPAIMLREMGINITPRFMCHDFFKEQQA